MNQAPPSSEDPITQNFLSILSLLSGKVDFGLIEDESELLQTRSVVKQLLSPTLPESSLEVLIKVHNSLYPKNSHDN